MPCGTSPTIKAATDEFERGLTGLLGKPVPVAGSLTANGTIVYGTPAASPLIKALAPSLAMLGDEGLSDPQPRRPKAAR